VGGLWLVNPTTGELRDAKIVTGVDDHSRFCVMAKVVERATIRAVCVAFAEALARFGVSEEVQSDIQAWWCPEDPWIVRPAV
jgi:hypothetical protein